MTPKTKNICLIWILAIVQYAVKTGISMIAIVQAMTVAWGVMNNFERQSLIASMILVFLSHTESFVNNVIRALKDGKDLPPEDNGNGNGHGQPSQAEQKPQTEEQKKSL